jgi:hypothetical protein
MRAQHRASAVRTALVPARGEQETEDADRRQRADLHLRPGDPVHPAMLAWHLGGRTSRRPLDAELAARIPRGAIPIPAGQQVTTIHRQPITER